MENNQKKIEDKAIEYSRMSKGEYVADPEIRISIEMFYITHRAIKHFVEERIDQGADIKLALKHLVGTVENPDVIIPNPKEDQGALIGRMIPNDDKALMIALDSTSGIKSIHFKRGRAFRKLKNRMIAAGGAAYPSSFLPEGNLAESLSALRQRSLGSLTR